jgi:ABC-type polysaccharide/polyol phosphate export permease
MTKGVASTALDLATGTTGHPSLALRTFKNLRKCLDWAWLDIVCQYRRSKIGPLWETINVLVMTLGITVIASAVFGAGATVDLIGYVGLGIITWSVISSSITEGASTFVRNASYITGTNLSIDLYVGRTIFKAFIVFCHHFILYALALITGFVSLSWTSPLALFGLLLLILNSYWMATFLAFVCARYRDVELIIRNLLQLAFFITPVFWDYRRIATDRQFIVDYNVFFYFIEIVRGPLLGELPPLRYYVVVVAVTIAGYGLAVLVYRQMRRQLAFYV